MNQYRHQPKQLIRDAATGAALLDSSVPATLVSTNKDRANRSDAAQVQLDLRVASLSQTCLRNAHSGFVSSVSKNDNVPQVRPITFLRGCPYLDEVSCARRRRDSMTPQYRYTTSSRLGESV